MEIKCIDTRGYKQITLNKNYELINETENRYAILNDKGVQTNYGKALFEKVPEIVALPKVTDIEIETSAVVDNEDDQAYIRPKVIFKFLLNNNETKTLVKSMEEIVGYTSTIGCGITEISGVNTMMNFINNLEKDFNGFVNDNNHIFELIKEELDEPVDFGAIADCILQDIISEFEGNMGLLTFSTNINNNNVFNADVDTALTKLCFETRPVEFLNPNSGNICKFWSITL
jgi:hypothetical protein